MVYAVWIVILLAAVLIDLFTSNMLFVWFGAGAVLAIILNVFEFSIGIQAVAFALTGSILTLVFYPIFKKKLKEIPKTIPREEQFLGKTFVAEDDIIDKTQIMIDGTYWSAENSGDVIKKGQQYKIVEIKGIKLIIKGI